MLTPCPLTFSFLLLPLPLLPPQRHTSFSTNRYLGLDRWLLSLAFFRNIPSETGHWRKLTFRGMGKAAMRIWPPTKDTEMAEDILLGK